MGDHDLLRQDRLIETDELIDPAVGTLPDVHSVYQPIVELQTGTVVGYEALARGLPGTDPQTPAALFAYARDRGLESELDFECQAVAMGGAIERGLPSSIPLFVNAEPRWLGQPWPKPRAAILARAKDRLQIVIEITERALVNDPAGLLAALRRIRKAGWGVALDDVGADPTSLALMPFIDPDVIKLDLRLIHEHTSAEVAAIVNAVIAQAERSDAVVLAEGIETEQHKARALAMGATLGQGWLLGRPKALPLDLRAPIQNFSFNRPHLEWPTTPFEMIKRARPLRTATKGLLLPMSHHLERHAYRTTEAPVLLAAFEDVTHFTSGTAARYADLAQHCVFVGALAAGMPESSIPGVRGAALAADDRLAGEWVVCVVGPHFSGALVAKDLGDTGPDRERRFDFAITYDRELVLGAARSLFTRIANLS